QPDGVAAERHRGGAEQPGDRRPGALARGRKGGGLDALRLLGGAREGSVSEGGVQGLQGARSRLRAPGSRVRPRAVERRVRQGAPLDERVDERSEEHTSELQSRENLVCRLLLEKK